MRTTKNSVSLGLVGAVSALLLTGCSPGPHAGAAQDAAEKPPVTITFEGSRIENFTSLEQLADKANAIVQVEPTGETKSVPLPEDYGAEDSATEDSAPTEYVELAVTNVIGGEVQGNTIWVVSPGLEDASGKQALSSGGPYILFLAPAMYGADDPAGGYVVVGGPSGMFVQGANTTTKFLNVDVEAQELPHIIDTTQTVFPKILKSEEELLREGP